MDPDPATSKICELCNQTVYPREIRSDGTCKSCARKKYYESRKELLAQRYRENREERLQKQKQYYIRKRESVKNGEVQAPKAPRNRRKKTANGQQQNQPQPDYSQRFDDGKEPNGQSSSSITQPLSSDVSSPSSSAIPTNIDLLNSPPTLVKVAYPFTTSAPNVVTTQPMAFFAPNGVPLSPYITWEMISQPPAQHQNGRL